jgi:hypothetical protein
MMPDQILVDGDHALFMPAFGAAIVVVRPGVMSATGNGRVQGKKVCVKGDEKNLEVPGCAYTAGPYLVPGVGTLRIDTLAGDQVARVLTDSGKRVLLKGGTFTAIFNVQEPAKQPTPTGALVPDPITRYSGSGTFNPTNFKAEA